MLKFGDVVKFKESSAVRYKGRCSYDSCAAGSKFTTYGFTALEGEREGRSFTVKLPYGRNLLDLVTKQRKAAGDDAIVTQARDTKRELETKGSRSLDGVEAGDLVTVSIQTSMGTSTYDFKVFEVDYRTLRIKGYKPNTDPGSRKGWINVAHKDVSFVMKTKAYFDPRTDSQGALHQARADAANNKRQATKRRRAELRSIFG